MGLGMDGTPRRSQCLEQRYTSGNGGIEISQAQAVASREVDMDQWFWGCCADVCWQLCWGVVVYGRWGLSSEQREQPVWSGRLATSKPDGVYGILQISSEDT